jgi:tetratricopeptide (TPR) repeat protein
MRLKGTTGFLGMMFLVLPLMGQDTAERIEQTQKLIDTREYKKAEAAAREILQEEPDNAKASCMLGISLLGQDRFKEAEASVQEILAAEPENAEANYVLGLSRLDQDKFKEAETFFLKAEKTMPATEPEEKPAPEEDQKIAPSTSFMADSIQIGLARVFMEQKQLDKAQAALSRAEKIRRHNPDLYFYRGMLDAHRKDYAAAARDMDKSIELDPRRPEAYYYSGIAYSQIKQMDKVVDRFQTFLKLAPDAPEAPKVKALLRSIRGSIPAARSV